MAVTIGPIAVNASADDASELATTVVSITADPLANCDTANVWNAWVFRGITIPAGATITSAYLTINFTSTSLDEPDVTIYGLDTATPAAFQVVNADISERTRTTASVDWAVANAGSADINTSDLSSIVTELLASYTYSNGVMGFCWTTRAADSARDTSVTSYDGDTALCARLTIVYSAPSASISPSPSVSPSISPSYSLSASPSISPSISQSYSVSPSISVSVSPSESPSISPSYSVSPSISPSFSVSPSISQSASESVSISPSESPSVSSSISSSASISPSISLSVSTSISPSYSVSPSESPSISISVSPSISPSGGVESESVSLSISPSISLSGSASPSSSPSPSIGIAGTVCWGHDTGVLEDNARDFAGNWYGTGAISGSGDAEQICLEAGEYMISEIVETGDQIIQLLQNNYAAGDDVLMYYRTGATPSACFGAIWLVYTVPFTSLGYVQVKLESTLSLQLDVSANGRYLVDGGNNPFLLIGDSPQGLVCDLTPAQMITYMTNRAGYGINCIQVHLLAGATFGGNSTTFAAQDGTTPFTTTGDISTVREAFFVQIDNMISLAANCGMVVMLTAAETIDALTLFVANGTTKCTNFGIYLGNRYKDFPNIIWNFGNDFNTWDDPEDAAAITAVCDGIKSVDTNHLHTAWLDNTGLESASRDSSDWDSRSDLDFVYTYNATYDLCLVEYAHSPVKPLFMGEANYENWSLRGYLTTPYLIRKQNYWSILSGAYGVVNGFGEAVIFEEGWEENLDNYPGLGQLAYLVNLLNAYDWWLMVPDTTSTVITTGRGTYSSMGDDVDTNDYATCAYIAGSLAMIYMPTNRTMTVDMSEFSGTVTCRWYDPTDGSYTADAASPHANSGTHDFSRATANSDGAADWILVLEV